MKCTSYTIQTAVPQPLRIAVCSDLHDRPYEQAIALLQKQKPDLIALPGDIGEDPGISNRLGIAFMGACAKIATTVYTPGNHDKYYNSVREIADAIRKTGAVLLDDSDVYWRGIWIGGLTTGFRGQKREGYFKGAPKPNLEWLDRVFCRREGFKLLLSHHPEYYPAYLRERDVGLIVSGHAHGGQWQFFGRGVLAPGQGLFPKYTYGVHENRLVISRGMGDHTWIPRLFNPHELLLLDLLPE